MWIPAEIYDIVNGNIDKIIFPNTIKKVSGLSFKYYKELKEIKFSEGIHQFEYKALDYIEVNKKIYTFQTA